MFSTLSKTGLAVDCTRHRLDKGSQQSAALVSSRKPKTSEVCGRNKSRKKGLAISPAPFYCMPACIAALPSDSHSQRAQSGAHFSRVGAGRKPAGSQLGGGTLDRHDEPQVTSVSGRVVALPACDL